MYALITKETNNEMVKIMSPASNKHRFTLLNFFLYTLSLCWLYLTMIQVYQHLLVPGRLGWESVNSKRLDIEVVSCPNRAENFQRWYYMLTTSPFACPMLFTVGQLKARSWICRKKHSTAAVYVDMATGNGDWAIVTDGVNGSVERSTRRGWSNRQTTGG